MNTIDKTGAFAALALGGLMLSFSLLPEKTLLAEEIYPRGNLLLFSAYSIHEPEISSARAAGFTAIGPYHARNKSKTLRYARTSGLPLIYSVGPKVDFADPDFAPNLLLEEIGNEVREVAALDSVAMWNVRNEEIRFWKPAEMDWLARITAVIRENDPLKRPIMMYEPNHRDTEDLLLTGKYLDTVAKGAYSNLVGMKEKRTWLRWSMEQVVSAAGQTGNVPIAILLMHKDQETAEEIAAIPAWVRHDVYLSLMTGAKGIIVYSASNRRKGFEEHFSLFYDAYANAATELNGAQQLGRVFLFGESRDSISIKQTDGPESQRFVYQKAEHTYPVMHSRQFELEGDNYLFISNSANEPIEINIEGFSKDTALVDPFSGEPALISGALQLDALEIRAFRWSQTQ